MSLSFQTVGKVTPRDLDYTPLPCVSCLEYTLPRNFLQRFVCALGKVQMSSELTLTLSLFCSTKRDHVPGRSRSPDISNSDCWPDPAARPLPTEMTQCRCRIGSFRRKISQGGSCARQRLNGWPVLMTSINFHEQGYRCVRDQMGRDKQGVCVRCMRTRLTILRAD